MKICNFSATPYTNNRRNLIAKTEPEISVSKKQSFKGSYIYAEKIQKKLFRELKFQKLLLSLIFKADNPEFYNLKKLDGLQEGIDIFKGLSLKEIQFAGEDMHSLITKRGCYNKCLHCYPGAKKPLKDFSDILFEDFKSVLDGYKELKNRTGISFIKDNSKQPYQSLVFDADNIEVAVPDLKGKIHEFPELNKLIFEATGKLGLFDTSGWTSKSNRLQNRAERIVKYYSNPKHMEEISQFNISINPFHSMCVKANELREKGYDNFADNLYQRYIERMGNAFLTCKPIMKEDKFNTIVRAFDNEIPNMDGYNEKTVQKIIKDIKEYLFYKGRLDSKTTKKHFKNSEELNEFMKDFDKKTNYVDKQIILTDELEKLLKKRNPQIDRYEIWQRFPDLQESLVALDMVSMEKDINNSPIKYSKMIDINGKVFLSDNYRVIPTNIQFNFINKNKTPAPLTYEVEDFVLTKDML